MNNEHPVINEGLEALDKGPFEVTEWESNFLQSLLTQTFPLTPKQQAVLVKMAEAYLDPLLAAELRGQCRLFV